MIPNSFRFTTAESVNGSNITGYCSNLTLIMTGNDRPWRTCYDPTSSVLFDGIIPALTGLDGDVWATQLLTLRSTSLMADPENVYRAYIIAYFPNPTALSRVEVVMFNCRPWGISAPSLTINTINPDSVGIDSCNSLVRTCVPLDDNDTPSGRLDLFFDAFLDSSFVHLAEVTFYNDGDPCPPDAILSLPSGELYKNSSVYSAQKCWKHHLVCE